MGQENFEKMVLDTLGRLERGIETVHGRVSDTNRYLHDPKDGAFHRLTKAEDKLKSHDHYHATLNKIFMALLLALLFWGGNLAWDTARHTISVQSNTEETTP